MRLVRSTLCVVLAAGCQTGGPSVSTTEQSIYMGLAFSPPSGQNFGSVQVGTSSLPLNVTIYPVGASEVYADIGNITSCAGFVVNTPGPGYVERRCMTWDTGCNPLCQQQLLPENCLEWYPDVTYSFTATFQPQLAQAYGCAFNVNTSLGLRTYSVSGTGTAPPIDIDVTPPSIPFGDVRRNTASSPATVNVRNAGGQPISVNGVSASAGFAITSGPTGAYPLAVGTTQPYQVTCNPTATGPITGQLVVASNDPATPMAAVALSCNGIDSALDISPSPLSVTTRVGEPVERTFQLTNSGSAPMQLQSVALNGAGMTPVTLPGAGMMLGVGTSTTAVVRFEASAAGQATGSIDIVYDGGQQRTASINAVAQATSLSLVPDGALDFGPVCIGQDSTQQVVATASAEGGFKIDSVSSPAAPFSLTAPAVPIQMQGSGGNQAMFAITAAPIAAGEATSTVELTTDIPNGGTRTLTLSVTGLPGGVSATPPELDLGQSKINTTTIGQGVEVTNCSATQVMLTNPRIEGELAADFAIVAEPSLTVPANGKVRWLIVAQPHSTGVKTALFSVDHPGGTSSVMLIANGVDEVVDLDPADLRASYYACSTGSASAAWPLALALVPVLRRRRRR